MKRAIAGWLVATLLLVLFPSLGLSAAGTGTIKGTLLDSNGQPMVGYTVKVVDPTGAVHESPPTGADGKYEIPNLSEGSYTYQIIDPAGKVVPVQIPAVNLQAGTVVTQPIAIVPKSGSKSKLTAWLIGGGAAVLAAIAIASGNDDNNDDDEPSMTASTP